MERTNENPRDTEKRILNLIKQYHYGLGRDYIYKTLGIARSTCHDRLTYLKSYGMVKQVSIQTKTRGAPRINWIITREGLDYVNKK